MPHAHSDVDSVQQGVFSQLAHVSCGVSLSTTVCNLDLIAIEGHRAVVSPRLELRRTLGTLLKEVEIPATQYVSSTLATPKRMGYASEHIFRVSLTASSAYSIGYRSHAYSLRSLRKYGSADASTPQSGYALAR